MKNLSSSLTINNKNFPIAKMVKNLSVVPETRVKSLDWEVPLEKGMAIHSSILAWRILWTEKPGWLQSVGLQRVRHDWVTNTHTQSCPTLCDSMDHSMTGFPVHHQILKLAQAHVHQVSDAIQPSHPLFSPCPQSFPASGSFQISQFFASGGKSIRVSALPSVLPMNIQDWFPLGLTGLISLQSKGLSLINRERQIKTIVIYHIHLPEYPILKRIQILKRLTMYVLARMRRKRYTHKVWCYL